MVDEQPSRNSALQPTVLSAEKLWYCEFTPQVDTFAGDDMIVGDAVVAGGAAGWVRVGALGLPPRRGVAQRDNHGDGPELHGQQQPQPPYPRRTVRHTPHGRQGKCSDDG